MLTALECSTSIGRAACGYGTAYLLGINPNAGAAVGGLSVLVDKVSNFFLSQMKLDTHLENSGNVHVFGNRISSAFVSMFCISDPLAAKYLGAPLSLLQTFFLESVSRALGDIAGRNLHNRLYTPYIAPVLKQVGLIT